MESSITLPPRIAHFILLYIRVRVLLKLYIIQINKKGID